MAVSTIDALYHSGSEKLTTSATGITVTGTVAATAYTGDGSALTGTGSPSIVDNGNATAMTITSAEKVGIGTSSPSATLTASQSGNNIFAVERTGVSSGSGQFGINIETSSQTTVSYDDGAPLVFGTASSPSTHTGFTERMKLDSSGKVGIGGNPDSGRKLHIEGGDASVGITLKDTAGGQFGIYSEDGNLDFKSDSANTVRMRIRGDGNIDIGSFSTTGASDGVQINPTGSGARSSSDATGFSYHYRFYNPNGQCGYIMTNGSNTSFVTSSDYRLKENVVDLTGASARVNQLNPSRFNFIADGTDTVVDGFIAHEVATVVPEAIAGTHNEVEVWKDDEELPDGVSAGDNKLDDDGNTIPVYQGIDQSKLVPLLTAALQEALTEIASLKTRVEALEA